MAGTLDKVTYKGIKQQFEALGTLNQIMLYDSTDEELLHKAINRVINIEAKLSVFQEHSEINLINSNAGKSAVVVSAETWELIALAKEMSHQSKGAFDITVGPLVRLWGIGKKADSIPSDADRLEAIKGVNYQNLIINRKAGTVFLQAEKQAIDLSGIAKGYAAEEVKRILLEGGVKSAVINLGGNIIVVGKKPDQSLWRIGIQNPLAIRGEYVGNLSLEDKTVVTSGSNERFFIKNGVRYHHLLDPRTGKPACSGLLSVTVVSDNSTIADALTTALFVLGMEKGIELLKNYEAEAVFLTEQGDIFVTEGLRNNFQNK